jgi:hypothetical protein
MLDREKKYIIYASTCIVCSRVDYVYENLFEIKKKIDTQNKK